MVRTIRLAAAAMLLAALPVCAKEKPPKLKLYKTRYYVIHSDLDLDTVREAAVRLTAMAEEYHQRTKGFSGTIRKRFPFYLFAKADRLKEWSLETSRAKIPKLILTRPDGTVFTDTFAVHPRRGRSIKVAIERPRTQPSGESGKD